MKTMTPKHTNHSSQRRGNFLQNFWDKLRNLFPLQKKSSTTSVASSDEEQEGINLFDPKAVGGFATAKKKKRRVASYTGRTVLSVFLVLVITTCLVLGAFFIYVFAFIDGTMDVNLNDLNLNYTSILYVQNKETGEYEEFTRLHGTENRIWVPISQIPDHLQKAVVSVEDKRFFEHDGVDWKRTFSAFTNLLFHIYDTKQGGSTITQQLVKNLTGDNETSVPRKIREIMRARYLEGEFTKETILECYLNTIHLGPNRDGVQVAANVMFDKDVSELTLLQSACIAATIKAPDSGYNPYTNPENNKTRREFVLREMLNNGYISKEEYQEALNDDLGLVDPNRSTKNGEDDKDKKQNSTINSYYVDAVIEDVIDGLMKTKNYTYDYAQEMIYKGGYKIYTTLDTDVQAAIDKVVKKDSIPKIGSGKTQPQTAMVVMDYKGHIVGMLGGRGEKTVNRGFNFATQAKRQPGSSMKPIGAYAPALENNVITWGSTIQDKSYFTVNGKSWPRNYGGGVSNAYVSMEYAVSKSLNTIPAYLVNKVGIDKCFEFATQHMGLTTLVDVATTNEGKVLSDRNMSALAVGGTTYGTTVKEMTAAYATFGNLGKYYEPHTYTKVEKNHEVILEEGKPTVAMAEETAEIMNKLLQTVVTKGTGRSASLGSMPVFAKTGTTTDEKDRWFIGGTPYYVAACWYGYEQPKPMNGISGNPALTVWKRVMQPLHDDLEVKSFPESRNCLYMRYCTSSGLPATSGCPNTKLGWFKASNVACPEHSGEKLEALDRPGHTTSSNSPTTQAASTAPAATTEAAATQVPATEAPAPTQAHTQTVTTQRVTTAAPEREPTHSGSGESE